MVLSEFLENNGHQLIKNNFLNNWGNFHFDSDLDEILKSFHSIFFFSRDPFYIGKQVLFNIFTAFSYRKDFELKDELNWVMGQLHAGGFWDKWNEDQFIREVGVIFHF